MQNYYLAVDIGASSGRHILGYMEDGQMKIHEIHRFKNGMENKAGKLVWDTDYLFTEIVNGMKKCKEYGKIPASMSIDTWAADYVLLDKNNQILGDTYGYRDSRTARMDTKVYEKIPEKDLYARTGIQKQIFNTIYQLMAVKQDTPELLKRAKTFLMLPDYFLFLLTGNAVPEYTNATSTQLVNPIKKKWDTGLLKLLGYPEEMFLPLALPGTKTGDLKDNIQKETGFNCEVVLCASHDTASAVMAMPVTSGEGLYISSGTWSLMGIETEMAYCDEKSRLANFTNEGGYNYRFRYLKNIMGLWIIQSARHEMNDMYSFAELCKMAEENREFPSRIDVNNSCFLAPENMTREIQAYCQQSRQAVPQTPGEIAAVIYSSLAECYGKTIHELEKNTGKIYDSIHIIGGGSNASYLNQLTADITGKTVYAGPCEATAIGNIMAQMIRAGEFTDLAEARKCVYNSFDIRKYIKESNSI